ncbi:MAG: DUF3232 domain-containing protein [Clostridia bacterium]|nr:DUF3232 domain-containing protein [Clostridia bacterium]
MINKETLDKLINVYKDDKMMLEIIFDQLQTFEDYHRAIYAMETKVKIYNSEILGLSDYQSMVMEMDKKRTMNHDSVITAVNVLDRLAEQNGFPLFYEGTVSVERPFRREVANAILAYTEEVIKQRK